MSGKKQKTEVSPVEQAVSKQLTGSLFPAAQEQFESGTEGIYQGSQLADESSVTTEEREYLLNQLAPELRESAGINMDNILSFMNPDVAGLEETFTASNEAENARSLAQINTLVEQLGIQSGQTFGREILPQLQDNAAAAGQFTSSKAGLAEGIAGADVQGDLNLQIAGLLQDDLARQDSLRAAGLDRAFAERTGALNRSLTASSQFGDAQSASLLPEALIEDIGAQMGFRSQQELDDFIQQFNAPRNATTQNLNEYAGLLYGAPDHASITTPGEPGVFQSLLGATATAAGAYKDFTA